MCGSADMATGKTDVDAEQGFQPGVNPNPKTRVTHCVFKPENLGLESLQTRVFGFEF